MSKGSTTDVASMGDYRHLHRVVLAFILQTFQQMSGINLVTQYLALMFIQQFSGVNAAIFYTSQIFIVST